MTGDTSTDRDIYYFQFGPRASTLRNVDYYYWGWPNPETNAWGTRLQDGGAVLGFSYHDLICRLKVDGPDDAWGRLKEVIQWFRETQAEGGYRRYYENEKARGAAQGGKDPGAVGVDMEFFESVLVPQVMLYGFMGFEPTLEGFKIGPRLPREWRELKITRVHLHDVVLELTAKADGAIAIQADRVSDLPVLIELPYGRWRVDSPGAELTNGCVRMKLRPATVEFRR